MPTRIHFFGHEPGQDVMAMAAAMGIGEVAAKVGADVHRFDRIMDEGPRRWVASEEADADLFVFVRGYSVCEAVSEGAARAKTLGKPCLFFHFADDTTPIRPDYGVVFRASLLASQQGPHEHVFPALCDDMAREAGGFRPRKKSSDPAAGPAVGFCGYVGTPWQRMMLRLQGRDRKVLGLSLRNEALRVLGRSDRIRANFIRRTQFWGGAISRFRGENAEAKRRVRQEYIDNLAGSEYVLCLRGAGNFSYRFYETLAMGRVPLFINTDNRLPFEDAIDWQKHVVWIEQDELPEIANRVADFHAALSDEAFQQLQRDNRQLWEDYFRPTEAFDQTLKRVIDPPQA
ncbi:MAG: exostosin family protein [Planctomycetota bacterium]